MHFKKYLLVLDRMFEGRQAAIPLNLWLMCAVETKNRKTLSQKKVERVMTHEWIHCSTVRKN